MLTLVASIHVLVSAACCASTLHLSFLAEHSALVLPDHRLQVFEKVAGELQGDQSDVALQVLSRVFIALNSDLEDKVWAKQCGSDTC